MFKPKSLFLFGIGIFILGFLYWFTFAGIPYQDPPQYLVERYQFHDRIGNAIILIGAIIIFILAPLQLFVSKTAKRK